MKKKTFKCIFMVCCFDLVKATYFGHFLSLKQNLYEFDHVVKNQYIGILSEWFEPGSIVRCLWKLIVQVCVV